MRIYLASSWKNYDRCLGLSSTMRNWGHEVDCFCDSSMGRYVFRYSEVGPIETMDSISFLQDHRSQKAFREDRGWLDWCEAVVMLLPCGKSAHLEAGYAKGQGKKLAIYGNFPKGDIDVMYGFADAMIRHEDLGQLREALAAWEWNLIQPRPKLVVDYRTKEL